jgi:DNA-binding beta-propeller fold protein YncE
MLTRTQTGCALAFLLALPACTIESLEGPTPQDPGNDDEVDGGSPTNEDAGGEDAEYSDGYVPEPDAGGEVLVLPAHSRGSAVAVSRDDSIALVVNRDVGSASVLDLGYDKTPSVDKRAELSFSPGSEPWQAVFAPDGDTAYVILRKEQQLVRIKNLKTKPKIEGSCDVGSEPTGVALSPTGKSAFVANWQDGTISVVDTAKLTVRETYDLNAALVSTGFLGEVKPRAALAHPRALVVTNNLDANDKDETLYVTEYFGQQTEPEAADGSNADTRKVGVVYAIKLADGSISTIKLASLPDIGFKDQDGGKAGCYPNQVQAIDIAGNFAFVSSVCASPKGPLGVKVTTAACTVVEDCAPQNLQEPVCALPFNGAPNSVCVDVASVKTTTASVVSVIDLRTNKECEGSAQNLNAPFAKFFADQKLAAGAQRFPLFVTDIAFVPGTAVGYLTANGTDSVFRVRFSPDDGKLLEVGASTSPFIDLAPAGIAAEKVGQNPIGIAILAAEKKLAVVANDVTRNVSMLDFNTQSLAGGAAAAIVTPTTNRPAKDSTEDKLLKGKHFFNTGLGRWSLRGQGWGSCQSCHGDSLTDNVTWYFARGPRQSVSLDGSFASTHPEDQRIFNWTGIFDEVTDFENNVRGQSGGVGASVSLLSTPPITGDRIDLQGIGHNGLSGSATDASNPANPLGLDPAPKLPDWLNIEAFMKQIRTPRAPTNLDPQKVLAGAELFEKSGACQGCHGGEKWTVSRRFYTPSVATNAALNTTPFTIPAGFPTALLPAQTPANQTLRFANGNAAAFDQIQCAIRPVGTFNVAEPGAGIAELRADMKTVAQGDGNATGDGRGYNAPSLLGMGNNAPYLHAGQVRTLEALFADTFDGHHQSLAPNFLTESDPKVRANYIDQLVQFLLSIDEQKKPIALPTPGAQGGELCPATFTQ